MRRNMMLSCALASCLVIVLLLQSALQTAAAPLQPAGLACSEHIINGGFETSAAWYLPATAYTAAYTTEQAHSGARSLRAGILNPGENVFSYSAASQTIVFPTDAQTLTLSLWWRPYSTEPEIPPATGLASVDTSAAATNGSDQAEGEQVDAATLQAIVDGVAPAAPLAGDYQYAILTNENDKVVARLLWGRSNRQQWEGLNIDVGQYAGRTMRLHVGVYNDGLEGVTAMYVDDVSLLGCNQTAANLYMPVLKRQGTPTPTIIPTLPPLTPTVTPTGTATITPTLPPVVTPAPPPTLPAPDPAWTSPGQAIEVFSPVAQGLYHSPIEVRGLSQTFEGVVNLRLRRYDGAVLGERTAQGGSVDGFRFFATNLRFTVSQQVTATLEIFETSAADGSEINKVTLPVFLLPGQPVVELDRPTVGATVCSPIPIEGYSNTFEATVGATLSLRDGTVVSQTTAMGGNLGIYAPFSTTISRTVASPQPLLVGAKEESPAGFGPVDYTRVPVTLYPPGTAVCP